MRRLALLWPLVIACSSSSPKPVIDLSHRPAPGDTSAQAEPPVINVATARVPTGFSLDGDATEWNLRAPQGTSKLAVAITGEAVFVATELGHPSPEGFWLGIASVAPSMLSIGTWEFAGLVSGLDCVAPGHMNAEGFWISNDIDLSKNEPPPNSPEDVQACKVLHERHEQRALAHQKRFTRLLRIEPTRVRRVNEKGELVAIEDAKIAWKPRAGGAAAEISLPRSALPRLAEAPLARLFIWAGPADKPPPEGPLEDEEKALTLPAPVSFEPLGELRARAYAGVEPPLYIANSRGEAQYQSAHMSYDLADPLRIEWIHYGKYAQTVMVENEFLYEKKATLGDIEVGHVRAHREWLAISKKGAKMELSQLNEGLRGVIVRDGEIHVISYTPSHYTMAYGSIGPSWEVIAIGPDGAKRDPMKITTFSNKYGLECASGGPLAVMTVVVETTSPSFDTFGWKGVCNLASGKGEAAEELTWKWDVAAKQYTGTFNTLPVNKRPSSPRSK